MKISSRWINELLGIDISTEEMSNRLTATGLEVEGVEAFESIRGALNGLVVGEVLTCSRHPGADRLSLTTVDTGGQIRQIVCGAPNVAAGQKVIVALPGTTIYPLEGEPITIKESKIRGEKSEGMICAQDEIGLGREHDGIMVLAPELKTGTPVADLFDVYSDQVLEIGLTPNRADAISHIGVARDLAASLSLEQETIRVKIPSAPAHKISSQPQIRVKVEDTENCIRYSGLFISSVDIGPSPLWLRNKLVACGLRPVNNIVDITNFVMLECGQPMHAFDADKIHNKEILVKQLPAGTSFLTLDGKERKLTGEELMICDDQGGLCMAGVFGGADSGVTERTKNIFLESACFHPVAIRKASRHHALRTDSSFRFERGTDPEATLPALYRAAQLIKELAQSDISDGIVDVYPNPLEPFKVSFSTKRCDQLSGIIIPRETLRRILQSLDITIRSENENGIWELSVPRYRVDVQREADVIEEILRIFGYDNIPPDYHLSIPLTGQRPTIKDKARSKVSGLLNGLGFTEIMNNSLIASSYYSENAELVKIMNPLSNDLDILRPDLLMPGLLTISYNQKRQQQDLKLFEFGKSYSLQDAKFKESEMLVVFATGRREAENWKTSSDQVEYHYLLGIVEALCERLGLKNLEAVQQNDASFDWSASLTINKKEIGIGGLISGTVAAKADVETPVYAFCLDWNAICKAAGKSKMQYQEVSKFPFVRRDLALLVDTKVPYNTLEKIARKSSGRLLKEVRLFDVYAGKNLPAGKQSVAMSFVLQNEEGTLTDRQIEKVMNQLIASLEKEAGATLR